MIEERCWWCWIVATALLIVMSLGIAGAFVTGNLLWLLPAVIAFCFLYAG